MSKKESNKIILKNVRLSYPNLFKAKGFANPDGTMTEPKYSASFIMDKKQHSGLIEKIQTAVEETTLGFFKKKTHLKHEGLRDGAEKEDKDGYGSDKMFLSASSKGRPQVVGLDPKIPLLEEDGVIYAGCYVNACVSPWAYDHKLGGKGVSFNLLAVQFLRDGEPFGETVDVEEVFSDESEADESEDPLG